jgi:hypothetical protein
LEKKHIQVTSGGISFLPLSFEALKEFVYTSFTFARSTAFKTQNGGLAI